MRSASISPWRPWSLALVLALPAGCRFDYELLSGDELGTGLGGNDSAATGGGVGDGDIDGGDGTGSSGSGASAGASGEGGTGGDFSTGGDSGSGGSDGGTCMPTENCSCQTHDSHGYWFCTNKATYTDAASWCATIGMNLVRIDDETENTWLLSEMESQGLMAVESYVIIGATEAQTDVWTWEDGTTFWDSGVSVLYSNWTANHPQGGVRDCAGVIADGTWMSSSCTNIAPFVCERL